MATDSVCVWPGMPPAMMMVAPNSPSARANPRMAAATRLRAASGSVMVRKTRHGPAPSVDATCS